MARPGRAPVTRDHPRSRGVYTLLPRKVRYEDGSSPLARGLRETCAACLRNWGIIPARAGFTRDSVDRDVRAQDHPRSRGVYLPVASVAWARAGSSPLARGLHFRVPVCSCGHGIIPARAGFTPTPSTTAGSPRDHPRSRGVYPPAHDQVPLTHGSSPLARGLRPTERRAGREPWIIPARAGFTRKMIRGSRWGMDHPRSRGVY